MHITQLEFPSKCLAVFSVRGACRRTLADIIMEKITEKQTEVGTVMSEVSGKPMPQLDPRIIEVYKGVNKVRKKQWVNEGVWYQCSHLCMIQSHTSSYS